ncbi:dihydrofolate reductase family protein [Arhodomonas aquaeolei]|uniref:dihydrofolate reductase family protein n=1 Tax=Arhodomonas aquaeolei TaxID=2369 RepID=UPI00036042DE|nr:dihydrofolate reductase family protein [Arhodomonas aquaeolei]MCS4505861.1 dihydrofolate reductase family protein [Arhodomonas aquaeolei]
MERARRRIVMFNWVTADGFFAGSDGDLDWVVPDAEQARATAGEIRGFDTVLFGRRTYEMFEGFWRHADIDESGTVPDPHHPGRRSEDHGAVALALNRMTKLIFSASLEEVTWEPARLLRSFDPREIEALREQPGGDMIVFGSGSIVSQLMQHDMIDEYQLAVCPVFIGNGRSLFSGASARLPLELLESRPLASGDVMLRYGRSA